MYKEAAKALFRIRMRDLVTAFALRRGEDENSEITDDEAELLGFLAEERALNEVYVGKYQEWPGAEIIRSLSPNYRGSRDIKG